jgi:hypothetical protein
LGNGAGYYLTTGTKNTIIGQFDGNNGGLDIRTASNYIVLSDGDGNPRGIFDGSGNLLVGTTDSNLTDNTTGSGIVAQANGALVVARQAATPFYVNRTGTSDGTLVDFRKDGGTVGTIGVVSSDRLYIGGGGNNGIGIDQHLFPTDDDGILLDAAMNLGASTARYKDLYISGGVAFDTGTAANYLDDYEEGTWTPAFQSTSATFSYASQGGTYTKVGRLVMASFRLLLASAPSGTTSNTVVISGLPFSTATLSGTYHGGSIGHYFTIDLSTTGVLAYQTSSSASTVELKVVGDNIGETAVLASHLKSASEIRGQIIYHSA